MVELTNAIISAAVSAVVGGGVVKVWAGRLLERDRARNGEVIERLRGDLEAANRRIQAELDRIVHVHRIQFETEFQALRDIWGKATEVRTTMQVLRPEISVAGVGHDSNSESWKEEFGKRSTAFNAAFNALLDAVRSQEPFYPADIHGVLEAILSVADQEIKHVQLHRDSEPDWYETGRKNYDALEEQAQSLVKLIRERIAELAVY